MLPRHRFGRFEVCSQDRRLLVEARPVPLSARAFDLLLALIERRNRLVTKDELLRVVWNGSVVGENNLHKHVCSLRSLLGADAIVTIPGRGYRFALALDDEPADPGQPPEPNSRAADARSDGHRGSGAPDRPATGDEVDDVDGATPTASAARASPMRFGQVEVRPLQRQLLVAGQVVPVGSRAFDVLLTLIRLRPRIVTKNELFERVWPDVVVEENNLQTQVSTLRKLVGPAVIETIPGHGYRFATELTVDALPSSARAVPAPANAPAIVRLTNLPVADEALFGRGRDLAALTTLVANHRLVTILGAGGIGKSCLAKALARPLVSELANGVWWVDLASVTGVENIALAIANAANLQLSEGVALSSLLRALGPRETWLVLDNCERCADDAANVVAHSLAAAPGLRILVTTQAALNVQDEQTYRLDVLAVPPPEATLEDARACGAVQLFEHRARAADHRFSLNDTNVGAAVRLCRRLDGIALAIEMAAARLPLLGLDGLNAILGDRLRLLKQHRRAVPARQQTLRATLDWSHMLLDEAEQVALRRLSVFAGSFRLDVAQQVATSESLDAWAVLDAVAGLVDKSLVQLVPHDPPRYRLLETTRLYASERLHEHAEAELVAARHGCAMALLANEVEDAYWTTPDTAWLARYLPDYEDLRAAFHRACHTQDADIGAATLDALFRLDHLRAILLPMRIHIQSAFSLAQTSSPMARARLELRYSAPFIAHATPLPKLTLARRAVAAFRISGDRRRLYEGLLFAAENSPIAGEFEQAEPLLREALALVEAPWPARLRWLGAFHATRVYGRMGDAKAQRSSIRSELEFAEQAGSPCQAASARVNLVDAALMAGNYDEAVALGGASVDELRTLNLPHMLSISLLNLCAALIRRRDLTSARRVAAEALPAARQNDLFGTMLCHLALLAASLYRADLAVQLLGFADSWFRRNQSTPEVNEARSMQLTYDLVHATFTPAEVAALTRDGERLTSAQAYALAAEVLPETGLADSRGASAA